MEDDNGKICLTENTTVSGKTEFACIEGQSIIVGKDCMLSSNIMMRTGDSHNIEDFNGVRLNLSKHIIIGDHVWIGEGVTLLKGCTIASNNVVGTKAVLTKKYLEENTIIAGIPGEVVKRQVKWNRQRKMWLNKFSKV